MVLTRVRVNIAMDKRKKTIGGVTLLELIIALSIISIVALLSFTVYSSYALRGRRVDAVNALLSISLAEERYRSNNTQYGTLAQVWGGVTTSSEGYYTLAISNVTGTTYTITATAVGTQANDSVSGTSCNPLTFVMNNGTITKTPTVCWP